MWQRYNQTSHIFEKSVDNGVSWLPLPLSGAVITEGTIPNVAYTNAPNTFNQTQIISSSSSARLLIIDPSRPVDQRRFDIINNGGLLALRSINDAETVEQSAVRLNRNGNVTLTGSWLTVMGASAGVTLNGGAQAYIQNTQFGFEHLHNAWWNGSVWVPHNTSYPAWLFRVSSFTDSVSFFRAPANSGAFAGLLSFTNTGAILERGRTTALGDWIDFAPVVSANLGTATLAQTLSCRYALIGKTFCVNFYITITLSSTPSIIYIDMPAGFTPTGYSASAMLAGDAYGMIQTAPFQLKLNLYRRIDGGGSFPAGTITVGGVSAFPIA
jgi:hypothetical protein